MTQYIKHNGLTVSKGNIKLNEKCGTFNLTCIYSCTGCYGFPSKNWPNVAACLKRNMVASKKPSFVDNINHIIKRAGFKVFRPHSEGEFYSLDYFKAWQSIALANKQTFFVAYTRSKFIPVDYYTGKSKQSNFRLIDSIERPKSKHMARIIEKGQDVPQGWFLCPADKEHDTCLSSCNYCYDQKIENVRVALPRH